MKNSFQDDSGFCAYIFLIHGEIFHQSRHIGRISARSKSVQFFHDTRFHFVGRLVGEGHGEDMPMIVR
ncbi:hypothetical protein SDC9_173999 [bioreactor metagenome]|uniref:Uncharacterized protein n=1 Tax=bioreactor metagenome TaxID=1076179 RepID=A0A645GRG0_9ZZZZ